MCLYIYLLPFRWSFSFAAFDARIKTSMNVECKYRHITLFYCGSTIHRSPIIIIIITSNQRCEQRQMEDENNKADRKGMTVNLYSRLSPFFQSKSKTKWKIRLLRTTKLTICTLRSRKAKWKTLLRASKTCTFKFVKSMYSTLLSLSLSFRFHIFKIYHFVQSGFRVGIKAPLFMHTQAVLEVKRHT